MFLFIESREGDRESSGTGALADVVSDLKRIFWRLCSNGGNNLDLGEEIKKQGGTVSAPVLFNDWYGAE